MTNVILDGTTRLGQTAICAILNNVPGLGIWPDHDSSLEMKEFRGSLYAAISGLHVDRCLVASDGKKLAILQAQGTPYFEHLKSEGTLIDLLSDGSVTPARGLWIFEGRVATVRGGSWEYEEYDDQLDGDFRAVTDEDRRCMGFDDEEMINEAYSEEIDIRERDKEITIDASN